MDIWQRILARLEGEIGKQAFGTWLRPTSLLKDDGAAIHVRVPNRLFSDWIRRHYADRIAAAAAAFDRSSLSVDYVVDGDVAAAIPPAAPDSTGPSAVMPDAPSSRYTFD